MASLLIQTLACHRIVNCRRIKADIYGQQDQDLQEVELEVDSSSSEEESEIEDFQSVEDSDSDSSSDAEDESDDIRVIVQTRSGRLSRRREMDDYIY